MKKKWFTTIFIYIVLVAICIAVVYVVPSVRGLLEKTYVTEWNTISISDEVSGYIVRDEFVYVASEDCEVTRKAVHNNLVKAGSKVVDIKADEETESDDGSSVAHKYRDILDTLGDKTISTESGRTQQAGYISYFIDGEEDRLSTYRLRDLNEDHFKKFASKTAVDTVEGKCSKGEPIFKVTRNSKWYLVFYLKNADAEKYSVGRTVRIRVGEEDVPVKVADIEPGEKTTRIALSCKLFFEGFLEERTLDTVVTLASAEGLVLKDSSLVEKDGQIGVLVKNKLGEHVFKPVSIKADNGENCVAYSDIYVDEGGNFVETIGTYDEIVESPTQEEIDKLNNQES
ncbi:MAG: hypothetical protein IJI11_03260 [Mogibacterium sp.]|nr:hypothetical protein [Mogibacterium sp.]